MYGAIVVWENALSLSLLLYILGIAVVKCHGVSHIYIYIPCQGPLSIARDIPHSLSLHCSESISGNMPYGMSVYCHKLVKVVLHDTGKMIAESSSASLYVDASFCSRWAALYIYVRIPVWYRASLVSSYTYMVLLWLTGFAAWDSLYSGVYVLPSHKVPTDTLLLFFFSLLFFPPSCVYVSALFFMCVYLDP